MVNQQTKIAIFMAFSGDGGVERMMINLIKGMMNEGYPIDLVLAKAKGSFLSEIPDSVSIIKLGTNHTFTSLPALVRYLKNERPVALLVAKHRAGLVALIARRLAGVPNQVVLRLGTTVSASLQGKSSYRRWLWYRSMRWFYPWTDKIIAVSNGVAEDIINITGLPRSSIQVVHNPVITIEMKQLAEQEINHPWLQSSNLPVVIGIGRLTRQKDFPTLIKAFAIARKEIPCRLMIFGEGSDRIIINKLISELDIKNHVELPGFVSNPYAYLNRAKLFVLSSRWEGSPNALTEAMALGIPVVATDCPSGPREILRDGHFGKLVPVANIEMLAQAIIDTLRNPLESPLLQSAVTDYSDQISTRHYLKALGLGS